MDFIDLVQKFSHTYNLGINIKELPCLDIVKINEEYDAGFDYNDGEEGVNGLIYYRYSNILIATKVIHGGDDYYFKFTLFGINMIKLALENYFIELLKTIE